MTPELFLEGLGNFLLFVAVVTAMLGLVFIVFRLDRKNMAMAQDDATQEVLKPHHSEVTLEAQPAYADR